MIHLISQQMSQNVHFFVSNSTMNISQDIQNRKGTYKYIRPSEYSVKIQPGRMKGGDEILNQPSTLTANRQGNMGTKITASACSCTVIMQEEVICGALMPTLLGVCGRHDASLPVHQQQQ